MSLNSQIFSLRQAIIKAKRKAKGQITSSDEDQKNQSYQHSESEQSFDPIQQTKRVIRNVQKESKFKEFSIKQKQIVDQKVGELAKSLYSSRKKTLSIANKSKIQVSPSPQKCTNLLQKAVNNKKTNLKESIDRSPLTYSKTNDKINVKDSRISNFSINSTISNINKSSIQQKLQKLRRNEHLTQGSSRLNKNLQQTSSKYQISENRQNYPNSQNVQQQKIEEGYFPNYQVTQKQLGIKPLFHRYLNIKHKLSKVKQSNHDYSFKRQGQNIKNQITEWKQLKYQLFRV